MRSPNVLKIKELGLFESARKYGGSYYRTFSQSPNSHDLDFYFHDDPVVQQGICAGASLDWLEYYLTRSDDEHQNYSNDIMKKDKNKIVTIQRGIRHRGQSLSDLLILYGLKKHDYLPFNHSFQAHDSKNVAHLSSSTWGVNVINYSLPGHGNHVAVFYVDENKNMYVTDVHRGDVFIPFPGSSKWLEKYFSFFTKLCGEIEISHFKPEWNPQKASQAFRSIAKDAIGYNPHKFGLAKRHRSVDDHDFDDTKISRAHRKTK